MRLKNLMSALIGAILSTGLLSCSNTDEPVPDISNEAENGFVEYTMTIDADTDHIWTRSFDPTIHGDDGLITIPNREINKLWYAVYYGDNMVYTSEDDFSPEVEQVDNGKFKIQLMFNKSWSSSSIRLFFWAGNRKDDVKVNTTTDDTDLWNINAHKTENAVFLNLKQRYYSVNPFKLNDRNSDNWEICNSFTKYSTLESIVNNGSKITLERPFTQLHIMTDEFHTGKGLKSAYPNGITCLPFWSINVTQFYYIVTYDFASGRKYGLQHKNHFTFDDAIKYSNTLTNKPGETTTYKGRTMDYLGCYYFLGGPTTSYNLTLTWGGDSFTTTHELYLKFCLIPSNQTSLDNFLEVYCGDVSTKTFNANTRYVIYNKANTSFTTNTYNIEIDELLDYGDAQTYEK